MSLTFQAIRSGPAQSPEQILVDCPVRKVLLSIRVKNAHVQATTYILNTQVSIKLGNEDARVATTDGAGWVTLEYSGDTGALPGPNVKVTWTENGRLGTKAVTAATFDYFAPKLQIQTLVVPVAGTVALELDSRAVRPWTSSSDATAQALSLPGVTRTIDWQEPPGTGQSSSAKMGTADAYATFAKSNLPCATAITVRAPIAGANGGQAWVKVGDGEWKAATDVDQTVDGVTFKRAADDKTYKVVFSAVRHETRVHVLLEHTFRKVLIVGEGTWFDYAAGLAEKYGKVTDCGLLWVYASQYDCTPVGTLPTDHVGKDPLARRSQNKRWDQRARVQGLQKNNLLVYLGPAQDDHQNQGRFDVTEPNHWQAVKTTHGEFDAVIFNNPHPGYGLHECVVFGLKNYGRYPTGYRYLKGKSISVHSFGFAVPGVDRYDDNAWKVQLRSIGNDFEHQRPRLETWGHTPRADATILWFDASGGAFTCKVDEVFVYAADEAAIGARFGDADEFADDATSHYVCTEESFGLHSHVMRSYRRYGPSVLRSGGELFIHGAAVYNTELTTEVLDNDDDVLATKMSNGVEWKARDPRFFVWYPTNFTSRRFHPSHFQGGYAALHDPPLDGARMYKWVKP